MCCVKSELCFEQECWDHKRNPINGNIVFTVWLKALTSLFCMSSQDSSNHHHKLLPGKAPGEWGWPSERPERKSSLHQSWCTKWWVRVSGMDFFILFFLFFDQLYKLSEVKWVCLVWVKQVCRVFLVCLLLFFVFVCLFSFLPSSLQMQTRNVWVKLWNHDSFSEAR